MPGAAARRTAETGPRPVDVLVVGGGQAGLASATLIGAGRTAKQAVAEVLTQL